MINRRHDGRASCLARQSLNQLLPREPQIHAPTTWKGGHESGVNQTDGSRSPFLVAPAKAGVQGDGVGCHLFMPRAGLGAPFSRA